MIHSPPGLVTKRFAIGVWEATASLALTGNGAAVTTRQGQIEASLFGPPVLITGHPAAILRAPDPARSTVLRDQLAAALKTARRFG